MYPCSQQDLYTIVETGWNSFIEHLPSFEAYSTLYSATTASDQLSALASARSLPDEEAREEVHKTFRVQLTTLSETCITKWSDMMSYVRDGFPENEYENKRLAAGYSYYASAEKRDWDGVKGLMQSGLEFANGNTAELTAGGMPATFIADFEAAKVAFEKKHQDFLQAEENAKVQTDKKIDANNALSNALTKMFTDGKKIFRNNAAIREKFTFDRVWDLVKGNGGGNGSVPTNVIEIGAYLFDENTLDPVVGGVFRITNPPEGGVVEATSGGDGIAELKIEGYAPNATVTVEFEISADGYETVNGSGEMESGEFYSIEVPMNPAAVA